MNRFLLLLTFSFFFVGCLGGTGDGSGPITIPVLDFQCFSGGLPAGKCDASAAGDAVYIGLISDTDLDCDSYLDGRLLSEFTALFEASANTTASYNTGFLTGSVSNWSDNNGFSVGSLPNVTYRVCGWIDSNSNNAIDSTDIIAQSSIFLDSNNLTIVSWKQKF